MKSECNWLSFNGGFKKEINVFILEILRNNFGSLNYSLLL
jgi:hypothetical protein